MSKADLGAASAYVSPTSYLQVQRGTFFVYFFLTRPFLYHKLCSCWKASNSIKKTQAKPKPKPKNHSWISSPSQVVAQVQVSEAITTCCVSLTSEQAGFRPWGWHWGTDTRNLCWFPAQQPLPRYVCAQTARPSGVHMHVRTRVLHQGLLDGLDRIPSAEQLAWSWPICGESLLSTRVRAPVSIKLHQTAIQKA